MVQLPSSLRGATAVTSSCRLWLLLFLFSNLLSAEQLEESFKNTDCIILLSDLNPFQWPQLHLGYNAKPSMMAQETLDYLASLWMPLQDLLFPAWLFIIIKPFSSSNGGNPLPSDDFSICWFLSGEVLLWYFSCLAYSHPLQFSLSVASVWFLSCPCLGSFDSRLFFFVTQFPLENLSQPVMTLWHLLTCVLSVYGNVSSMRVDHKSFMIVGRWACRTGTQSLQMDT